MRWRDSLNGRIISGTIKITVIAVSVSVICAFIAMLFIPPDDEFRHITMILTLLISFIASAPIGYVITAQSERLAQLNALLLHEANYDWLTKVMNRRAFFAAVDRYRESGANAAILLIDADHFKAINDQHGHHSGDEALKLLAKTVQNALPDDAILGRVGGEEFAVILPHRSVAQAVEVAGQTNAAVAGLNFITPEQRPCPLSVSIGVDSLRDENIEHPLRGADAALYVAKSAGRNGVIAYDDATMRHRMKDGRHKAA